MSKLYQLIQSEYKFEYITEYVKPEGHGFKSRLRYKMKIPVKIRLRAYFFMSKLYQLIQSEYKFEYITEYVKPEGHWFESSSRY